jgi:predicted transcriptional regulator
MSTENTTNVMSVESLRLKVENQQEIMKQLTNENEELYQQFNHLMIRNNKLLKRINDLQGIIDDLHIRIEELQLINGNILKLNDRLRPGKDNVLIDNDVLFKISDNSEKINDELKSRAEFDNVYSHWKNYPGQDAKNEPNLRKQALMLIQLNRHKALKASDLFASSGVGGVTGARYVATLKKFGLINYTGARKKGQYEMTETGINFIERALSEPLPAQPNIDSSVRPLRIPEIEQQGIPVKPEVKELLTSSFDHADL